MEILAFVCSHVFHNTRPTLLVSRADGDWQLLCGAEHEADEVPMVVGINHIFDRDETLRELENLPVNWEAERDSVGSPWKRTKVSE